MFCTLPIHREVMADPQELLAYDDIETVIRDHEYIAVRTRSCPATRCMWPSARRRTRTT